MQRQHTKTMIQKYWY